MKIYVNDKLSCLGLLEQNKKQLEFWELKWDSRGLVQGGKQNIRYQQNLLHQTFLIWVMLIIKS